MDYDQSQVSQFVDFIDNEYTAELLIDNLSGVMRVAMSDESSDYEHGFPIGGVLVQVSNGSMMGYALNNHLDFKIYVNEKDAENSLVIVGFEIAPRRFFCSFYIIYSIQYNSKDDVPTLCSAKTVPAMSIRGKGVHETDGVCLANWIHGQKVHVIFSYSVEWIHSNIDWEHRFDRYTKNSFGEETSTIHWYSIMNSFLIILFLAVSS